MEPQGGYIENLEQGAIDMAGECSLNLAVVRIIEAHGLITHPVKKPKHQRGAPRCGVEGKQVAGIQDDYPATASNRAQLVEQPGTFGQAAPRAVGAMAGGQNTVGRTGKKRWPDSGVFPCQGRLIEKEAALQTDSGI